MSDSVTSGDTSGVVEGSDTSGAADTSQTAATTTTTSTESQATPAADPHALPAWAEKRLGEMSGALRRSGDEITDLRARVAAFEATLTPEQRAAMNGTTAPTAQQPPRLDPTDPTFTSAVELAAQRKAFDELCNTMYQDGVKAHSDFDTAMTRVRTTYGGLDPVMVQAAASFPNPHSILYNLANDPAEFLRIKGLDPMKQAVEMAKYAAKSAPVAASGSKAPPPIQGAVTGGGARGAPTLRDEDLTDAQWIALRNKELAAAAADRRH